MKNLIILIIFTFGVFLYADGSELFPFGMNYSVCETWGDSLPEDEEFNQKYKTSMNWIAAAGIKWWRAQRAFRWCDVENLEDDWNFDTEDSLVQWCGERGLHLLPSMGYTAKYAWHSSIKDVDISSENKNRYPPDPSNWNDYEKYIDTLVERYDGDGINDMPGLKNLIPIKYWQFSNEPDGNYFLGDPDQYIEMYESTRVALKAADPDAKIIGLGLKTPNDYDGWKYFNPTSKEIEIYIGLDSWKDALNYLIASIDLDSIDVISQHIYNHTIFKLWLDSLRYIVGEEKPIWITETGIQNSDPFKAERGTEVLCTLSPLVTYSSDTGEIFCDYVLAEWSSSEPCTTMIDTFLNIEDTVVLYNRSEKAYDTIIYNGGPLMYKDTVTALAIDDTLTISDQWAEEYWHTDTNQAEYYSDLLDSIFNTPDFLNNLKLKVFFFDANNSINEGPRYPPIIRFGPILGPEPGDTTYITTNYSRQRQHSVWSVIDTNDQPYKAYDTIQYHILKPDDKTLQNITVGIDTTKTYQAMDNITAAGSGNFTIKGNGSSGGTVAMEAGDKISLKPGFRVEQGGYFYGATNPRYGEEPVLSSMKGTAIPKAIKIPEESTKDSIPKVFSCAQNYPNPFATSTTIKYGLPRDSKVNLCIFNLIGQKVKTLVDAEQSAGYKSVTWDGLTSTGKEAPKGVYFYTFEASDFKKHHKMILVK